MEVFLGLVELFASHVMFVVTYCHMRYTYKIQEILYFVIAAFAAVNALGTPDQVLESAGTAVVFSNITTFVGVLPTNDIFTCPVTAFYFVHYRLRAQRNDQGSMTSCIIALGVGSDEIQ